MRRSLSPTITCFLALSLAGSALAQSDPSTFMNVFNIGTVPPGSIFDVPFAVTGTSVGDGVSRIAGPLTPGNLGGDVLGSDNQLNVFDGGEVLSGFQTGEPNGLGSNVEVNLAGGTLGDDFLAGPGTTVNISGGAVGDRLIAGESTTFNITGGSVGESFAAGFGTTINVSGNAEIDLFFDANDGSTVNVTGGSISNFFTAKSGSTLNLSGGSVGGAFAAESGSEVNISGGFLGIQGGINFDGGSLINLRGGNIGSSFSTALTNDTNFFGGGYRVDGSAVTELPPGPPDDKVFTGILEDGTVFLFAEEAFDFLQGSTQLIDTPVAASTNPGTLSSGSYSKGVRAGETLTVTGAGELSDAFAVVGGTLNIEGGSVGDVLKLADAEVNVSGGSIGIGSLAFSGSVVNITGGIVGSVFGAFSGSEVNISGGEIGGGFDALSGSEVNISGGIFDSFEASEGSTVNVSGGEFNGRFLALDGAVNLLGVAFFLNGVELTELVLDQSVPIPDRNVTLAGVLADGTPFEFDLNTANALNEDWFTAGALLSVTLVEPQFLVGDYNGDGTVDAADYTVWRDSVGATGLDPYSGADGNGDGQVTSADYDVWVAQFGMTDAPSASIPEPGALVLGGLGLLLLVRRR